MIRLGRVLAGLFWTGLLTACPKPVPTVPEVPPEPPLTTAAGCSGYAPAERSGVVPSNLPELSGLVASELHEGVFFGHNDSGHAFELFAIDASGTVLGDWRFAEATPPDVEDIAAGPCEPGSSERCLFLGDIGDNAEKRPGGAVYRLREPAVLERGGAPVFEALPFRYEDGPHNAEALVVHPLSGEVGVITKAYEGLGTLYVLEGLSAGQSGTARAVGSLRLASGSDRLTTAADVHPSGERLILRTYSRVHEARVKGAATLAELIAEPLVGVPSSAQPQSEAIAYFADGNGYLIGTEGAGEPLVRVDCR